MTANPRTAFKPSQLGLMSGALGDLNLQDHESFDPDAPPKIHHVDAHGYSWVETRGVQSRMMRYGPCLMCGNPDARFCIDSLFGTPCVQLVPIKDVPTFPADPLKNPDALNTFTIPHMEGEPFGEPYSLCGIKFSAGATESSILQKIVQTAKSNIRNDDIQDEFLITKDNLQEKDYLESQDILREMLQKLGAPMLHGIPQAILEEEMYPVLAKIYCLFFPNPLRLQGQCLRVILEDYPELQERLPSHLNDYAKITFWHDGIPDEDIGIEHICSDSPTNFLVMINRNANVAIGLATYK